MLRELLTDQRDEIVRRFVAEVERKDLAPAGTVKSQLVDHIPKFIEEIVSELDLRHGVRPSQDVVDVSPTGRQHGEQRFSLGYDLEAVVREYGVLRHAIIATAKAASVELSLDEVEVLFKCLNVGVAEAVTEYVVYRDKEFEKLRHEELAKVEAASRAKDEFVALLSHELRTPLNAIIGWVRLLRTGSLPPDKRDHANEVIERNANTQAQLVSDLLDISRMTTGRIRINPSQVDLSSIVDIVVEQARLALETKRIEVTTELDRERSTMRGDADRLQQVVWNLLTNALKFTPKEGKIRVVLRRIESDLELTVSDTGKGIVPELLSAVFVSFRQSDSSVTRSHGGLGIGLPITRHLVTLHGGTIRAESEGEGRGATFIVRLPVSPLVSPTLGVTKASTRAQRVEGLPLAGELQGLRVLVVDDDADARELVSVALETCGIEVRAVASASEAFSVLETFTPDVLVSDIGMPETDGYGLIRRVRALTDAKKARMPAIALTAFVRSEDRELAMAAGFNEHLTKPVEPADLVAAIAALSGREWLKP